MRLDDEPIQLKSVFYDDRRAATNELILTRFLFNRAMYNIKIMILRHYGNRAFGFAEYIVGQLGDSEDRIKGFAETMNRGLTDDTKGRSREYLQGVRLAQKTGIRIREIQ